MIWTFGASMATVKHLANMISNHLGIEWKHDGGPLGEVDRLLVIPSGAAFANADARQNLADAVVAARSVVWIVHDYKMSVPKVGSNAQSPFRACFRLRHEAGKSPVNFWTTVSALNTDTVNLNSLHFEEHPITLLDQRSMRDRVIYYGYYREGREDAFDRYMTKPSCQLDVSYPDSGKSVDWFMQYASLGHLGKFVNILESLSRYGLGLYIEDEKSHRDYHSPAARFYEMLSAGLPMAIQPEVATGTLNKAGYYFESEDVCWDGAQLKERLERAGYIQESQNRRWYEQARLERDETLVKISNLWSEL